MEPGTVGRAPVQLRGGSLLFFVLCCSFSVTAKKHLPPLYIPIELVAINYSLVQYILLYNCLHCRERTTRDARTRVEWRGGGGVACMTGAGAGVAFTRAHCILFIQTGAGYNIHARTQGAENTGSRAAQRFSSIQPGRRCFLPSGSLEALHRLRALILCAVAALASSASGKKKRPGKISPA